MKSQGEPDSQAAGQLSLPGPGRYLRNRQGFSIIEMSLVIALILGLLTIGGISVVAVREWQKGKQASLALQAVYAAQRGYLADHPTSLIGAAATADLVPYLPTGWTAMPTAVGLNDEVLELDHSVMPPLFLAGATPYDPSGRTDDGLWDVGE